MQIEKVILKNLLRNETYTRKILPFLKEEYFTLDDDRTLYKEINDFIHKYNVQPTSDALKVEINSLINVKEDRVKSILQIIDTISSDPVDTNLDWLVDQTEKFCQEKAVYNAIMTSIEIMNNSHKVYTKGAIPQLLSDALSITFDPNIGHSYTEDYESRYEYYHRAEEKLSFDLDFLNKITKGGVAKKTLNVILGGVHTGKTLFLCHLAASYLAQGKNVLYITLEMSEEEIARRIDTNLLNVSFEDLEALSKDLYMKKFQKLKNKTDGKLIIKEYPSTTASIDHFRALVNEISLKQNFKPDVILIDYLNLCASSRLKASAASDTYTYIKAVAEEVRGLAKQLGIPFWSATQLNRVGFGSSDPDMTNVSESFGLPATVDLLLVLIVSEELKKLNQIMVKQLKNRYDDMDKNKRFVLGVDKSKMKLYDTEQSAQVEIDDSGQDEPVMDKSKSFHNRENKFKSLKV